MKRAIVLGATLALLLVPVLVRLLVAQSPPPSQAPPPPPTYTLTDLGPLNITAAPSGATALNASGQVTGFRFENFQSPVCFASGANRAFLWDQTTNPPYTELGTLGGFSSFAYGINQVGQIVGTSDICPNNQPRGQRAFIWQLQNGIGVMTALDPSTNSSDSSAAFAININGDVAGYTNHVGNAVNPQAVIWKGGTAAGLTLLLPLPCQFSPDCQTRALAINDSGQAAGWGMGPFVTGPLGSYNSNQAVMWGANGQPTGLGSLGNYFNDQANAIDSKGDVVGYSQIDPSTIHAALWQNGNPQSAHDLGATPGIDPIFGSGANITDNNSSAWGINSKGDIVGISAYGTQAVTQGNGGRAFLYTGGQMYDLLSLVAPGTTGANWRQLKAAWAINDAGQIVGVGIDPNQAEHGFLLTPIITPTTTAVSASVNPSVFGQQVSFTATVTPTQSSALTPTGNVTFNDGATVLGTVPLSSGSATFNAGTLGVGGHTITASYAGDNNFGSSISPMVPMVNEIVNPASTTTTLSASPKSSTFGQSVTLTAMVTVVAPGAGAPSGTVTFSDNGTALVCSGGNQNLSAGQATCQYAFGTAGLHPIVASYSGDGNFTGSSTSSALALTVGPPPATHFLVSAPAAAFSGAAFTFSVTALDQFNNAAKNYTGTVHFTSTDGQAALPADYTFTATDNGTHVFNATLNKAGNQTITATDAANATIAGTSSPIVAKPRLAVAAPPTTIVGTVFNFIVTAQDGLNKTVMNYVGTVHFTSTDALSVLPADYTFTAADNGTHVFSATLNTAGNQTITVTDTLLVTGISGTSNPIAVSPPPPVQITDNETIHVTDAESFPDVFDAEAVHVTDAVFVTPLIQVSAPVAEFSVGSLGFSGQSGSQTITVSDIGQASLTLASATISGSSQFTITQIACSNSATSFSTALSSGGACTLTIGYTASATPANDTGMLTFADNAALSNLQVVASGPNYTQSISLNGAGAGTAPPPPPPAVIAIPISETIHVADTESFPDVFDSEPIKVTDQVAIQVLNTTATSISIGGGSVYGTPVSVVVSVGSATAPVTGNVALSVDGGTPATMLLTNGSATFNLGVLKAGNHALAVNFAAQGNFTRSSAQATLAVTQATPTIIWANPAAITLGTALSGVQLNATAPASVSGTLAYTPALGTVLGAGSHTLSVTFSPFDSMDYTTATASVTILVLNTIVGTNIGVTPVDLTTGLTPVTVNFSNVTKAGVTSLATSSAGAPPPPAYQPGVPQVYYDISTTATYTGSTTICIHYSGITFIQPPHLFHLENGVWVDRTTSIDPVNMIVCGTVTSFSPFALFAPFPVLTITANSVARQYGQANPSLNNVTYNGFVNGDTSSVLSGTLSCVSPATPASAIGAYPITCSGLISPNYTIKFAPGVLTITPVPLTVTAANAQRVYGAANPLPTGTITGIQNGDNISATYATAATPASPVGAYAIAPTLVDPTGKLGNYKVTLINGTLTVVQASTTTTLSASPNPSTFGQSVTLTATLAPIAPGAGTATGKVTFFDGSTTLGTSTLSSTDTATLTTSSLAAGSHSLTASYSGDPNFSGSSSPALADQVLCGVLISLSSSTVPLGGTITVTGKVISCSITTQTVVIQFTLSGPAQPNSCSSTKSVMFTTPPFSLAPKISQTVSFPFKVPTSGVCPGTYTITAATLVNGVAVNNSTATLTITAH